MRCDACDALAAVEWVQASGKQLRCWACHDVEIAVLRQIRSRLRQAKKDADSREACLLTDVLMREAMARMGMDCSGDD